MAWFTKWFNTPYYHTLYRNRDYHEAEKFIKVLTGYLNLPAEANVVDLACGRGRHAVYLNKLGYSVLGLDLSEQSIAYAQDFANEHLHFKVHDMRHPIPISTPQDAVFSLFTSFGYFDETAEDNQVFSAVAEVLKTEGYFVLDFLNEKYVRGHLVPEEIITRGTIDFDISRKIEENKVVKNIRFLDKGHEYHYQEIVKLQTLADIEHLGEKQGLTVNKVFGNYQLEDFQPESSPRCIIIFQKEA